MNNYTIRQLTLDDVQAYKLIRLEALRLEPGMFGNSLAKEEAFTDDMWTARVSSPYSACFGLYFGEELVGITGIFVTPEKPEEAYMTQSYIRKTHRGKHLSRLFYQIRIDWARAHGVQRLEIGHRASNTVSKAANQRFGFQYTRSEPREWPDGSTEDMLYYHLSVASIK